MSNNILATNYTIYLSWLIAQINTFNIKFSGDKNEKIHARRTKK
jgi:hypothetical protein